MCGGCGAGLVLGLRMFRISRASRVWGFGLRGGVELTAAGKESTRDVILRSLGFRV